jgi:hypothetical protein
MHITSDLASTVLISINFSCFEMLCFAAFGLRLPEIFAQDDRFGDLAHGLAALPAFRLHGTVRLVLAQREIAL